MEYELIGKPVLNMNTIKEGSTTFNQDVTLIVGIVDDTYGFTKSVGTTIENIPLSKGIDIPQYIYDQSVLYIQQQFPSKP